MRGSQCCLALLVLAGQTVAFAPGASFDLRRRDSFRFAGSLNSRLEEARLQEPSRAANLALQGKPRSVRLPVRADYAVSCAAAPGSVSTTPLGGILHKLVKVAILVATVFMTAPFHAQARDGPRLMEGKADTEGTTFSSKRSETSHPRRVVYLVATGTQVTDVKVLACLMSVYSSLLWLLFISCRPTRSAFSPSLSPSLPFSESFSTRPRSSWRHLQISKEMSSFKVHRLLCSKLGTTLAVNRLRLAEAQVN